MSVERSLIIFTKQPWPGKVKRRLISHLGADGAARLYTAMLEQQIATAHQWGGARLELCTAPDRPHPAIDRLVSEYGLKREAQQGGGLGERMRVALNTTLEQGRLGVLIGGDIPSLSSEDLAAAFLALESGADAVFTPIRDGGFGLMGVSRPVERLFEGVEWGSAQVMGQTRLNLQRLGWQWQELEERWDVDYPEDLGLLRGGSLEHFV